MRRIMQWDILGYSGDSGGGCAATTIPQALLIEVFSQKFPKPLQKSNVVHSCCGSAAAPGNIDTGCIALTHRLLRSVAFNENAASALSFLSYTA